MLTEIGLTLDATDAERVAEFWRTAVGYLDEPPPPPFATRREWLAGYGEVIGEDEPIGGAWLIHPDGIAPRLAILAVPEPKTSKNRLHMDLRVSRDAAPGRRWPTVLAEVDRLTAAGASVLWTVTDHHVTMADPEGNEFCVS